MLEADKQLKWLQMTTSAMWSGNPLVGVGRGMVDLYRNLATVLSQKN